ncbi:hypothetical protein [Hufsiella ginkgonis]|uniref:DUF3108 domain-containing protein n=1 Tax=Hufsiella ginkgonis TaxID=2695274 RepID=A0A7K1XSI2_9SPHI|nr:hypothetical protein [Hufsiella ginkgonis]MXV13924.1 hypothetical protein [Hufsiella ginkgonis]
MSTKICLLITLLFPLLIKAQTAEEVINKNIKYGGGAKLWKTVRTITSSGEYNYSGAKFPFRTYAQAPNLYKFVVPLQGKYYAQGFNGKNGWKIDAFKNETRPTTLTGSAARAMANEADVEIEPALVNYRLKGHRATLEAKTVVGGKNCFNVKLVRKTGETEHYFFDDSTFELRMKTAVAKNPEMGGEVISTTYSDYRNVSGLKFAFKSVSKMKDQTFLTITVDKVVLNVAIAANEFDKVTN